MVRDLETRTQKGDLILPVSKTSLQIPKGANDGRCGLMSGQNFFTAH